MVAFAPLIKCDHCETLVEPEHGRCDSCRRRHGARKPKQAAPKPKRKPAKPAGDLTECVGIDGSGCKDRALITRDSTRKRCRTCQRKYEQQREPVHGGPPKHIALAQHQREQERRKAMR